MPDDNDTSAKQQEPLHSDMGGKEVGMSNLVSSEANNIALRHTLQLRALMCWTQRELNQNKEDLDPAAYPSSFSFVEPSKQETQPSNATLEKIGESAKSDGPYVEAMGTQLAESFHSMSFSSNQ
ncbi:hypothetical protein V6N12_002894 [Hibiscus sabdariffa]|uniref:Uncharacterized protein n=1 Tax=Hibiscus sabdariffa TaxID=183260 RepID=A0ABR2ECE9_9ROSI